MTKYGIPPPYENPFGEVNDDACFNAIESVVMMIVIIILMAMMMTMMMMMMMMMMMLASIPSDLHAHPPRKVYPGAEERAR